MLALKLLINKMRFLFLIPVIVALFTNCSNKNLYEKEIAIVDSTKIVLQVKLNELLRAEKNIEVSAFSKFNTYTAFLKSNVKDTLRKHEATAIQLFINSGEVIKQFSASQPELIKQTELSINQLKKLSLDAKEGRLQPNALQSFYATEKSHAEELIEIIEQNIRALNLSINNYRNSLPRTEEYIKSINNGTLPTVVADSTID